MNSQQMDELLESLDSRVEESYEDIRQATDQAMLDQPTAYTRHEERKYNSSYPEFEAWMN